MAIAGKCMIFILFSYFYCSGHDQSLLEKFLNSMYSGTPVRWTPLEKKRLSFIKRCPLFRGFKNMIFYIIARREINNTLQLFLMQ